MEFIICCHRYSYYGEPAYFNVLVGQRLLDPDTGRELGAPEKESLTIRLSSRATG